MTSRWITILPATLLLGGCLTTGSDPNLPLSPTELRQFMDSARDPRLYWITVRGSNSGPVFEGAHRIHPNQAGTLEFVSRKDTVEPIIKVRSRYGPDFPVLIDTSAQESWIDIGTAKGQLATPLGSPKIHTIKPIHVKEGATGYLVHVPRLILEQLHMESTLFYTPLQTGVLNDLARGHINPMPHAVLSYEFLRHLRYAQLDYPQRTFRVSSTVPYEPKSSLVMGSARLLANARAAVTTAIIDGKNQRVVLDSAGDFSLVMPTGEVGQVSQLMIGELVIPNVKTTSPEMHGLQQIPFARVGRQVLSRFKVTFDFRRNIVIFERPPPLAK